MSFVPDTRWRAFDSNGNPISGATLTIYTAGTTTPASIFRDAALVTPMSNPTSGADKADAAGYFPQIFAASNGLFDILLKNASGSTVASYLNVPTLGGSTGGISLDLTGSRFGVRNSGGTVYIEVGDPAGDDVGGTGNIGGWLGTQADLITINTALLNVVGRIKENSFKLPGVVRTEATTFTGVATVAVPLTNDPTGVRVWDIDIIDLISNTTNDALSIRFSYDGGSTFVSTSVYLNTSNYAVGASPASTGNSTLQTSGLITTSYNTGTTNVPGAARIRVVTPNSGNMATVATGTVMGSGIAGSSAPGIYHFGVTAAAAAGRATHVQLRSTGLISGVYRVVAARGLGET